MTSQPNTAPGGALKVLIVEDNPADAELMLHELRKAGYSIQATRVDNEPDYMEQLQAGADVILSDYRLPKFGGLQALELLQASRREIPFIVVSGSIGEDIAVEAMKKGADDYLLKDRMAKLGPDVSRVLAERAVRKRLSDATDALKASEEKYRTLFEDSRVGIYRNDMDGRFLEANHASAQMHGYTLAEFLNLRTADLYQDSSDWAAFVEEIGLSGKVKDRELRLKKKDGTPIWGLLTAYAYTDAQGHIEWIAGALLDITERKRAEDALRDSDARYRTLFDTSADGILIADLETKKFKQANPAVCRMLGYTEEELKTMGMADIHPKEDLPRVMAEFEAQARGEKTLILDIPCLGKDGAIFYADINTVKTTIDGKACNVGLFRDITERKQAEVEVRRQMEQSDKDQVALLGILEDAQRAKDELQFGNLILSTQQEASIDGILVVNESGKILSYNRRFIAQWGIASDVMESKSDERALQSVLGKLAQPEEFIRKVEYLYENRNETSQDEIALSDGRHIDRYSAPMFDADGKYYGRVWYFRDITERKLAEDERRQMEAQLQQAQKMESIGQLAAGIAHEINTPTQFIGDNTRFLQDSFKELLKLIQSHQKALDEAQAGKLKPETIADIHEQISRMDMSYLVQEIPKAIEQSLEGIQRVARIVRAMKEFSHPTMDEKIFADINKAVETTVTVARNEWKYAAELETRLDPNLPPINCLPGEINQVLLNLIINAAHAIEEKNAGTSAKGRIVIETRQTAGGIEIRVSDDGAGIPEKHRARIFELFFTTKGVGKGTGQGLALAYTTVTKRHGGSITFETETGKGTTFVVRLPIQKERESS